MVFWIYNPVQCCPIFSLSFSCLLSFNFFSLNSKVVVFKLFVKHHFLGPWSDLILFKDCSFYNMLILLPMSEDLVSPEIRRAKPIFWKSNWIKITPDVHPLFQRYVFFNLFDNWDFLCEAKSYIGLFLFAPFFPFPSGCALYSWFRVINTLDVEKCCATISRGIYCILS